MPVGVGSNRQPNQRLDGVLAGAVMGMQTVKSVEIGLGADVAATPGSQAHDVFALDGENVVRGSNRAGGIEGGMSNGEPIVVRVSVKPIPTLMKALPSVNLHARTDAPATIVRSDVCVVPAAAIVGEAMVRLALMAPVLEKYGGDSMEETLDNLRRGREAADGSSHPEGGPARKRHVALVGFMGMRQIDDRTQAGAEARTTVSSTPTTLIVREHGAIPDNLCPRRRGGVSPLRTRSRRAKRWRATRKASSRSGGGALTVASNRRLLERHAHRVFIKASPEQILARLRRSRRGAAAARSDADAARIERALRQTHARNT